MAAPTADRALVRRRQRSRVFLLRRRTTIASLLAFAALFGLAAQHVVKGATKTAESSTGSGIRPTFFDEGSSDFSFDERGFAPSEATSPQVPSSPGPPVAQSSVS